MLKKSFFKLGILLFSFLLIACSDEESADKSKASDSTSSEVKVAKQGDAKAQASQSVSSIMTKAAEQGEARAQFEAGLMYFYGVGVPVDMEKAAYWFEKAEKQGFVDDGNMLLKAQFNQL